MENYQVGKIRKIAIHIVISGYLFGFTLGIFNTCTDNVSATLHWGSMKDTYITIFNTIMPIGALLGASVAGYLMNHYGRRKAVMILDVIMLAGSIAAAIPFTYLFGLGRFLAGVAAGIGMTIPPSFLNEITPDDLIQKFGPYIQISINLGILSAYVIGLPLPTSNFDSDWFNYWWLFMFLFPGLLSSYQFIYFYFFFSNDSPLWLLRHGKKKDFINTISNIYTPSGLSIGYERFKVDIETFEKEDYEEENESLTYKELVSNKKYRKMIRNGVMLGILQQLSGINAVTFYSTSIFEKLGGGVFMSRVYTCTLGVTIFISSIVSIPLLKRFGRKTLLVSGQLFLAIDLFLLGMFTLFDIPFIISTIGIFLILVFFSYSLGATLWTYCGETLFDKIMGILGTVNLISTCIIAAVFPITVQYLGIYFAFFFFSGCMFGGVLYCLSDLIETKGKVKSEILAVMLG